MNKVTYQELFFITTHQLELFYILTSDDLCFQFAIVLCCASLSLGAPSPQTVVGFGDATPQEIAEIRAGTYGEMFDENPQYNFNYKVS